MLINRYIFSLLLLGVMATPTWAETPKVVVSIKPIHSLVAAVMQNTVAPTVLIKGNATPHSYALRPSDARTLNRANLFFWVGPELETFLGRIVKNLPDRVEAVALLNAHTIKRLPNRSHGFDHDLETTTPSQDPQHDHQHGDWDPHIWLNPHNAQQITRLVGDILAKKFPQFAPTFQKNVQRMLQRLQQLDQDLKQRLKPVKDQPFLVYHDAYHYFADHYGLNAVGAITLNPDQPSGARRIGKIRTFLKQTKVICLFAEPQFRTPIIATIIEDQPIKTGTLDPLGATLDSGIEHYFQLLDALVNNFTNCLQPTVSKPAAADTLHHGTPLPTGKGAE